MDTEELSCTALKIFYRLFRKNVTGYFILFKKYEHKSSYNWGIPGGGGRGYVI